MSKTALIEAIRTLDVERAQAVLEKSPALRDFRTEKGFNLLQLCCSRSTAGDRAAADRQLRLAKWLVREGFDPLAMHTFPAGEDGEEQPATMSLAWFAVAKAQNTRLARFFLDHGARANALWAAAWWGNDDIIADLVAHGDEVNPTGGTTPLHFAVALLQRGVDGKPELARRRMSVVKELLRLGADPNLSRFNGQTMLHTAIDKGFLTAFRLLLAHGANPDIAGKDGRTVREIASRKKDPRYLAAIVARDQHRPRR